MVADISGKGFFCSWSGGKDSCLALYHTIQQGGIPHYLFSMFTEQGDRSRSHGLPLSTIQAQARALGIILVTRDATWDHYETSFLSAIRSFKKEGIEFGVFGDIDLEEHLEWVERVCSSAGIQSREPLWKRDRGELLKEFLQLGFRATIVSVKKGVLDRRFSALRVLAAKCLSLFGALGRDALVGPPQPAHVDPCELHRVFP